jgi:hypothetical protein
LRVLFETTALYVAAGVSDVAFTPKVQRLLEHSETERMVSPVSFTEIAIGEVLRVLRASKTYDGNQGEPK